MRRGAGGLGAGALGAHAGAHRQGRAGAGRGGTQERDTGGAGAALRHSVGLATTRPRARGLGSACARRLSCGCEHGALGQFLSQYCF